MFGHGFDSILTCPSVCMYGYKATVRLFRPGGFWVVSILCPLWCPGFQRRIPIAGDWGSWVRMRRSSRLEMREVVMRGRVFKSSSHALEYALSELKKS